jgi:hypothetical protein
VSDRVGRLTPCWAEQRQARSLGHDDTGTGEHEVASEKGEAGGGVCEEREAGERDEHLPLIGSRAP